MGAILGGGTVVEAIHRRFLFRRGYVLGAPSRPTNEMHTHIHTHTATNTQRRQQAHALRLTWDSEKVAGQQTTACEDDAPLHMPLHFYVCRSLVELCRPNILYSWYTSVHIPLIVSPCIFFRRSLRSCFPNLEPLPILDITDRPLLLLQQLL
jgi:hypothetical protein